MTIQDLNQYCLDQAHKYNVADEEAADMFNAITVKDATKADKLFVIKILLASLAEGRLEAIEDICPHCGELSTTNVRPCCCNEAENDDLD